MYHHVLIPTDGSPLSTTALEKSLAFARDSGAKATIITVIEPFHIFSGEADQLENTRIDYERRARRRAARTLAEAQGRAKALCVPCEFIELESDRPYESIIAAAAQRGCDLAWRRRRAAAGQRDAEGADAFDDSGAGLPVGAAGRSELAGNSAGGFSVALTPRPEDPPAQQKRKWRARRR